VSHGQGEVLIGRSSQAHALGGLASCTPEVSSIQEQLDSRSSAPQIAVAHTAGQGEQCAQLKPVRAERQQQTNGRGWQRYSVHSFLRPLIESRLSSGTGHGFWCTDASAGVCDLHSVGQHVPLQVMSKETSADRPGHQGRAGLHGTDTALVSLGFGSLVIIGTLVLHMACFGRCPDVRRVDEHGCTALHRPPAGTSTRPFLYALCCRRKPPCS
jgi:hypothetical protein